MWRRPPADGRADVGASARVSCPVCELHAESIFRIEGMDCHEEVALIERRFRNLTGFESFAADVMAGRLRVQYDAARLSTGAITAAVADTGMRAWLEHEEPRPAGPAGNARALLWISGCAVALSGVAQYTAPHPVAAMLAALAIVTGGVAPARRAWRALRLRTFDMHVLMAIAVIGAIALGDWLEAGTVVFLFGVSQYLEGRSMDRARQAIRGLMDLSPLEAAVVRGGVEQRVAAETVLPGEHVRVRPGEKIPVDGRVVSGVSDVNQAPITGESLPVEKHSGHEIFAGTINGHGALEVEVTRHRADTTLARIIHLVEAAQAERAPSQTFVDRFARIYTPAVIALAVLIAIIPPLVTGDAMSSWIYRALVLLVIACPCALVIATPVAVVSALAAAARQGVLVKGGVHLERLAKVRSLAFDKTGTLTRGTPVVVDVIARDGAQPDDVLRWAAAVNRHSEHPIGRAIAAEATARGLASPAIAAFRAVPGHGAEADLEGTAITVGSPRLLAARGIPLEDLPARMAAEAACGRSTALVAAGGRVVGCIVLADVPREAARDVIDMLHQQRVDAIVMLTGDAAGAARQVADLVGVDEVRAELLPHDKVAAVRALKQEWGSVAMVGDGINDAPALAAADIGIVMGAAGSDAALEVADIALMGDDLSRLPFAIRLSRATVSTIHTNIAIALAIKLAFLGLAVAGRTSLWLAILADTGTSLLVVANGLRLARLR
jgi:Cd2+/Zn2+-exporting ATPase